MSYLKTESHAVLCAKKQFWELNTTVIIEIVYPVAAVFPF